MQQIARSVALAFNNLPRPHRVMLGSLTVVTLAVAVWRPYVYHPTDDVTPIVKNIELDKNTFRTLLPEASEPIDQSTPEPDEELPADDVDTDAPDTAGVHDYTVSSGDTLSSALNQYQGELSENQALLNSAELTLARYRKLAAQDALARQDLDSQIATVGQYRGAVAADQAQIASAKLSIEYARITAPISGRVGLRQIDPGNMVQSASSTGLVTITQMQPAAVTFSVPQSDIPALVSVLHQGQSLPATLFDQDNQHQLASGEVKFISNQIDTATGTVALKAVFANQDESLFANQFVNLRLQIRVLKGATVIPAQALQLSSDGSFVFVINQDNTVTRKAVTTGPAFGDDQQAILSGVSPGDRLVTEGIDRLTSGSKVTLADETPAAGAVSK